MYFLVDFVLSWLGLIETSKSIAFANFIFDMDKRVYMYVAIYHAKWRLNEIIAITSNNSKLEISHNIRNLHCFEHESRMRENC